MAQDHGPSTQAKSDWQIIGQIFVWVVNFRREGSKHHNLDQNTTGSDENKTKSKMQQNQHRHMAGTVADAVTTASNSVSAVMAVNVLLLLCTTCCQKVLCVSSRSWPATAAAAGGAAAVPARQPPQPEPLVPPLG